jgi:glycerol-3-phosphate dehydrogenase
MSGSLRIDRPRVVVIGGGGTGIATAYDLTRRGFDVTLLERGELTSGTTGRHHGQLHSGARYAVGDRHIGRECYAETKILTRIARQSIEHNYGIFAAVDGDDADYAPILLAGCAEAGIPAREIAVDRALEMEPGLNPRVRRAVLVPDGTIDAFRLALQFAAGARMHGALFMPFHRVIGIDVENGTVTGVCFHDRTTGAESRIACDAVVNAGGAWGGAIAALAGCTLPVTPAPGTMVAFRGRQVNLVVSRLHPPGDGDIVVPQRLLSIVGSTERVTDDPDRVEVLPGEVDRMRRAGAVLVPTIAEAPVYASWAACRPLAGSIAPQAGESRPAAERSLSRDFLCVDHRGDGVFGFYSVIGGKATVLRRMAEAVCDLLCEGIGINVPCTTADAFLPDYRDYYGASGSSG